MLGGSVGAALAFGTGHHGTTVGCLLAYDRLLPDLDVEGTKLQRSHGVDAAGHTTA